MKFLLYFLQTPSINCQNFPPACLTNISQLSSILLPLLYTGSAIMVIMLLIYAAYLYLKSGGDAALITRSQNIMTYAVVGIILITLAYFFTRVITYIFDVKFSL